MSRRASHLLRATSLITAGALVGCLQVLGFDDIDEFGPCTSDQDCPTAESCGVGGRCERACNSDHDCAAGSECSRVGGRGTCVTAPDGHADAALTPDSTPDRSFPSTAADAPSDSPIADSGAEIADSGAEAEALAATDDAADASECSSACAPFSWCASGSCLEPEGHGFTGAGAAMQAAASGLLHAVQLRLNVCGFLTGIGFNAVAANVGAYRLALYLDDGGGHPGALVAQTAAIDTPQTGANTALVQFVGATPPVLGCSDEPIYVWVAGVWNENAIEFSAESSEADWVWVHADVEDVLSNGFKPVFPLPANSFSPPYNQPHVYVVVADDPHLTSSQPSD